MIIIAILGIIAFGCDQKELGMFIALLYFGLKYGAGI